MIREDDAAYLHSVFALFLSWAKDQVNNGLFPVNFRPPMVYLQLNILLIIMLTALPVAAADYPNRLLWGDTHVHSSYSMDANMFGNTRLGPEQALRFARGEAVIVAEGVEAKLRRALDFLLVADHSESLGVLPMIRGNNSLVAYSKTAEKVQRLFEKYPVIKPEQLGLVMEAFKNNDMAADMAIQHAAWADITSAADRINSPGQFTALIGYEWGSSPGGNNLHRVVVFRDDGEKTRAQLPLSSHDEPTPEGLWQHLQDYEKNTGGRAFAIPHNSNLSNGAMFALEDSQGRPIDRDYAQRRIRWEPIIEVTQIKGDSEAHPLLSPDDEFADFARWDKTNLFGSQRTMPSMLPGSYSRSALKNGLLIESQAGINPFKFGVIGSTDSHTSLATADDDNYWGKTASLMPGSDRAKGVFMAAQAGSEFSYMNWEQIASGYAGVWARDNTREAIFDAMERREVYATTGPRITVRFFGGWNFGVKDIDQYQLATLGYQKGVPMGADLPARKAGDKAPVFLIYAGKDPDGANLDRIQIVKGWLDPDGKTQEKVFDIALSGDRGKDVSQRVTAVGNTVDVDRASYSNNIGSGQLMTVWQDPEFSAQQSAFYYARVIEIPTPRWSTYDAARHGTELPNQVSASVQQRAYTSPIWYSPISK